MSKATATPCSSCPSSNSHPQRKSQPQIKDKQSQKFLEVVFNRSIKDLQKDDNLKVKKVTFFNNLELKNLIFHGELQHRLQISGASSYTLSIFYEDLINNTPNYLEIRFLERKKIVKPKGILGDKSSCNCSCICEPASANLCPINCTCITSTECTGQCPPCGSSAVVTSSTTLPGSSKTFAVGKLFFVKIVKNILTLLYPQ
uniref:Uncharacterized protein n=1 Tax=viral metagenome TaxID=1070528 RepID=A0A6C0DU78_9ZZZZ